MYAINPEFNEAAKECVRDVCPDGKDRKSRKTAEEWLDGMFRAAWRVCPGVIELYKEKVSRNETVRKAKPEPGAYRITSPGFDFDTERDWSLEEDLKKKYGASPASRVVATGGLLVFCLLGAFLSFI